MHHLLKMALQISIDESAAVSYLQGSVNSAEKKINSCIKGFLVKAVHLKKEEFADSQAAQNTHHLLYRHSNNKNNCRSHVIHYELKTRTNLQTHKLTCTLEYSHLIYNL